MGDATCAWIGHNPSDGRMVVLPPTASKCPFDDARVLVDIDGEGLVGTYVPTKALLGGSNFARHF